MATKLKHRWAVMHNYLAGITSRDWRRLLSENRFRIDPAYGHRAAFITGLSWMNSWYKAKEEQQFGAAIAKIQINQPPLFILGHWRSGTTHLHYLLAQDTEQFAFANTYQVVNPHNFLVTEAKNKRRFAKLVPPTRLMDNMALSFDTPQEDEFAPCLMTLFSPYLGMSFPRREIHYRRYLTFDQVPASEIDQWSTAFVLFLKKLTFKFNRALLLKSPPHTARIKTLLQLFPDARFVHVHRDPYRVFQSTQHFFDTALWYACLQRPDIAQIDDDILQRYSLLYDAFFQDRCLLPESRFCEVAFEELERDPVGQVRMIYERLQLSGFETFQPKLEKYVRSLGGYQKNRFPDLAAPLRQRVRTFWQRSFDEWKYSL